MTRAERTYFVLYGTWTASGWFVAPIYPLFLMSRGLDLFEINLVLAIYLVTIFLFEVPTGAVADRFGRRVSFLASCGIRFTAFVLYARAEGFADCVLAEVIDGFGTTLASGSLEAWAVDARAREGAKDSLDRFFSRAQVLSRLMMVASGIVCGYLAWVGWTLPWIAGAAGFALAGAIGFRRMDEVPRASDATSSPGLRATIREGFTIARESSIVTLLFALTAVGFFAAAPVHMLWQARLRELGGEALWIMGWVWALLSLAALVGSVVLPRVLGRLHRARVLFAATLWRGALLALAAAAGAPVWMLAAFLLQEVGFGLAEPVFQAWLNEHVPSERRATLLSLRSMFGTLGGGLGLVAIGWLAREAGIPAAWTVSAVIFALSAPGFALLGRLGARARPKEPPVELEPVPAKPIPPTVG